MSEYKTKVKVEYAYSILSECDDPVIVTQVMALIANHNAMKDPLQAYAEKVEELSKQVAAAEKARADMSSNYYKSINDQKEMKKKLDDLTEKLKIVNGAVSEVQ